MIAARLVRLIETHSDELADSLMRRLLHSETLVELCKVPPAELRQRAYEVYRDISGWLLGRTEEDIEKCYMEIGARRPRRKSPSAWFWERSPR